MRRLIMVTSGLKWLEITEITSFIKLLCVQVLRALEERCQCVKSLDKRYALHDANDSSFDGELASRSGLSLGLQTCFLILHLVA